MVRFQQQQQPQPNPAANPLGGDDPTGASASMRGLQGYWDYQTQHPQMEPGNNVGYIPTVHPSSMWEGFFQRMQDNGVDKVAGSPGMLPSDPAQPHHAGSPFGATESTYQPGFQQSAMNGLRKPYSLS